MSRLAVEQRVILMHLAFSFLAREKGGLNKSIQPTRYTNAADFAVPPSASLRGERGAER